MGTVLLLAPTHLTAVRWRDHYSAALARLMLRGTAVRTVTDPRDLHGYSADDVGLCVIGRHGVRHADGIHEHSRVLATLGARWVRVLPTGELEEVPCPWPHG